MLQYFCLCEVIRQYVCGKKEIPVLRTYHLKTIFLWMAEEVIMLTLVGNSNRMNILYKSFSYEFKDINQGWK